MEEGTRELTWYKIIGGPKRVEALYSHTFISEGWNTNLLGFIERAKDGSWDVFAPCWLTNEPSAGWAKKRLVEELRLSGTLKKFNF